MSINENHGIVCKFGIGRRTVQIFNFYHQKLLEMPLNCKKALEIGSFVKIKGKKQNLITDTFKEMKIHSGDLNVEVIKNELHMTFRVLCAKTGILTKEHKEKYGGKARHELLGEIGDTGNELGRLFEIGRQVEVLVKFAPQKGHIFNVVKEVERDYVPMAEFAKKTKAVDVPELNENIPVGFQAPEPIETKKRGPGRPKSKAQPVTTPSEVKMELKEKEAEVPASRASRKRTKVLEESEKEAKLPKHFEAKESCKMTTRAQKKATERQNE